MRGNYIQGTRVRVLPAWSATRAMIIGDQVLGQFRLGPVFNGIRDIREWVGVVSRRTITTRRDRGTANYASYMRPIFI